MTQRDTPDQDYSGHLAARPTGTNGRRTTDRQPRRPSNDSTCSDASKASSSDSDTSQVYTQPQHLKIKTRRRSKGQPRKNVLPPSPPLTTHLALDCEMVGVGPGGSKSSAARVTIVNWHGKTVYDVYVQQSEEVTDYRTFVSGIKPCHLWSGTAIPFQECRSQVLQLLQNRILVGHALENDLKALKIRHPWWLVRDTALYSPYQQIRRGDGMQCARKLKDLARIYLQKDIQSAEKPHDPYEDAYSALQLYQLVQGQWERDMHYDIERTSEMMYQQQAQYYQQKKQHQGYHPYQQQRQWVPRANQ